MALISALDVRFVLRTLQSRPGYCFVVVATLALGIGATTATFSLLDATLLRPIPFERSDRLMMLWGVALPERSIRGASVPEVADWRAMNRTLRDVSVFDPISLNLRYENGPTRISAERVNAGYFPLLGVRPALGRVFTAEEDSVPDAHPVAVVSHSLWQTRFSGNPSLVGTVITLNDRPFTVIGVMPEGFRGLSFTAELWVPVSMMSVDNPVSLLTNRGTRWLGALGRLRDGVSRADAERDLDAVAARLASQYPEFNERRGVTLMSLEENSLGSSAALFSALFKAVVAVLLIACANVMSLQLSRATSREREIALRLALGAGRRQLVRQLLTEGMVLAGLGGAAGVLLAYWGIRLLVPLAPSGLLPAYARIGVDGRALGFTLGITVLCGIACGLAPLLRRRGGDLADALREGARASSSGLGRLRRPGVQQALVAGEVALALMLLAGAGLMIRNLRERLAVAPGFEPANLLAARLSLPRDRYAAPARAAFVSRLTERLGALPGVTSAAVATDLPLRGLSSAAMLLVEGPDAQPARFYRHSVSPEFFSTLRIPLLRGRAFTRDDGAETPRVAVVSAAMARRFWPGQDPVGRRFHLGDDASGPEATVVGVIATVRSRDLTTDLNAATSEPDVYVPFAQRTDSDIEIAVRAGGSALPSAEMVQREVAALDPGLPLYRVEPMTDAVRSQNAPARFGSLVLGVFGGLALLLAAIGLYGVISFVVGLSSREIAIRVALGANRLRVLRVVMGSGMTLVLAGLVLGVLGARLGGRLLESQLYGVRVTDAATLAEVTAAVLVVALLAIWIPARRAATVEPHLALKEE
jgi:putative ABC transport system permease protein